jgi:hypothetical protein
MARICVVSSSFSDVVFMKQINFDVDSDARLATVPCALHCDGRYLTREDTSQGRSNSMILLLTYSTLPLTNRPRVQLPPRVKLRSFSYARPIDPPCGRFSRRTGLIPRSPSRQSKGRIAVKSEVYSNDGTDTYGGGSDSHSARSTATLSTCQADLGSSPSRAGRSRRPADGRLVVFRSAALAKFHTFTVRSRPPLASSLPSREKASSWISPTGPVQFRFY